MAQDSKHPTVPGLRILDIHSTAAWRIYLVHRIGEQSMKTHDRMAHRTQLKHESVRSDEVARASHNPRCSRHLALVHPSQQFVTDRRDHRCSDREAWPSPSSLRHRRSTPTAIQICINRYRPSNSGAEASTTGPTALGCHLQFPCPRVATDSAASGSLRTRPPIHFGA